MLYSYFVESGFKAHDNTELFKKINELEIKMSNIYTDENFEAKDGLDDCLRGLQPRDFLIVRSLLDLEHKDAKKLQKILKELEDKSVELISIEQPELSHGRTYSKLREVLRIDKYFREYIREKYFRKAVEQGRVGRPRIDKERIEQALKMYDSGLFKVKEIREIAGISKTKLFEEVRKQRDLANAQIC